jgi:hypothetical protein
MAQFGLTMGHSLLVVAALRTPGGDARAPAGSPILPFGEIQEPEADGRPEAPERP